MRPKVLLTHLSNDYPGDVANAVKSLIHSQCEDTDFSLTVYKGSELADFAGTMNIPCYEIGESPDKRAIMNTLKIARQLQQVYNQMPFDIVHVHSDKDHTACCLWKLLYKPHVHIIRVRLQRKPVPKTRLNSYLHNKMIAVNLFPNKELADAFRDASNMFLKMDNPVVIDKYPDSSSEAVEMIRHCYRSLISPSYVHSRDYGLYDWSNISLTYIINFYLNQNSLSVILDLLKRYEQYSPELLDKLHFVIVDDCSPMTYVVDDIDLNITWLKIDNDIMWNQGGARNLGTVYAKSDNILLTDVDFEFPQETLIALAQSAPCGRSIYKIRKKDLATGRIGKGHANTFFMSRSRFLRYYGYDEEFSGHYGAEDFRFIKFHKAQGSRQKHFNSRYFCYHRNDIDKKEGYHDLYRDLSFNTPVDSRKKFEMDVYGHEAGHSRTFLNFRWEKIHENKRDVKTYKTEDRLWKKLWYWRWLAGSR